MKQAYYAIFNLIHALRLAPLTNAALSAIIDAMRYEKITDASQWNTLASAMPRAHILQSWEWGEFKHIETGWVPHRLACYDEAGALVALASVGERRVMGLPVLYAPKAPLLVRNDLSLLASVLGVLEQFARQRRAVWLKLDPDIALGYGAPDEPNAHEDAFGQSARALLEKRGWRFSAEQIQFRNSIQLDLRLSADELLSAMSQNTRRKVRTAEKRGVVIRQVGLEALEALYALYQTTAQRDGFLIRPLDYYRHAWQSFMQAGMATAFMAELDGTPIAAVIIYAFGQTAWYFYGASSNEGRDTMPNYALQWAAMQWAQTNGYTIYDMWGAPDVFDETDRLWGVYEFKRGFRGQVVRTLGAWDYAPYPALYALYRAVREGVPKVRRLLKR